MDQLDPDVLLMQSRCAPAAAAVGLSGEPSRVGFRAVPRYTVLIGVDDGPDRYQELTELIDAPNPRAAAQVVIDRGVIHPDDQFPQILVIEEARVAVFTRDDAARAATDDEDLPRLLARGPATATICRQPAADRTEVEPGRAAAARRPGASVGRRREAISQ